MTTARVYTPIDNYDDIRVANERFCLRVSWITRTKQLDDFVTDELYARLV
jgi:hypothetical protein